MLTVAAMGEGYIIEEFPLFTIHSPFQLWNYGIFYEISLGDILN